MLGLLIEGDWDDKLLAFMGLSAIKEERALFYIIDAAGSMNPVIPDSEQKFYEIKDALKGFGCTEALVSLINDGRLKFKGLSFLIELLGEMRCAEAAPLIRPLLGSNVHDIRKASAKALREIEGDPYGMSAGEGFAGEGGESVC